ncbi:hypothetical protein PGR6_19650 [Pseudomonas sp. GR 6-02]|nr:hypothetical protein PGR6_19650 [Pseudomonas sp. GR 6-02]
MFERRGVVSVNTMLKWRAGSMEVTVSVLSRPGSCPQCLPI